jgi:DNA-binding SARP family transcriptional activator
VTLRNYVKCLRRLLAPADARIVTRDPGYQLRLDAGELDLLQFGELARDGAAAVRAADWPRAASLLAAALALWRDEPLSDIPSDALRREITPRLERIRLQALEGRVDADLNLGRHAELILEVQGHTAEQPLHERFHAQLMLALYRSGRGAEALAAYDRARGLLARHLGAEPGPELRDLHLRMLREDADLAVARAGPAAGAVPPGATGPAPGGPSGGRPVVGRPGRGPARGPAPAARDGPAFRRAGTRACPAHRFARCRRGGRWPDR